MASVVGFYKNGTVGARDGTLISTGNTEATPFAITTLNVAATGYFRAIDAAGADPGEDSAGNFSVTCPTGLTACFTANGTYVVSPTVNATKVVGANRAIYFKQTVGLVSGTPNLVVGSVTWVAGSRVAQVGTVAATPGAATVALSWTDISGETAYEVDRATNSGFTTNLVHLTATLAADSTSYMNNAANGDAPSDGTQYFYRVRGVSALGVGAWSAGVSATPASYSKTLTIDTTASGANVSSDQTDVAVPIYINATTFPGSALAHFFAENSTAKQCRVYDYDGTTQIPFEVEQSDGSTSAILWAKKPTVKGNYNGGSGNLNNVVVKYGRWLYGTDQDSASDVWRSEYIGVYHLGGNSWGSSPEAKDSTSNAHHFTNSGSADGAGKIGQGRVFDTDILSLSADAHFDPASSDYCISCWAKPNVSATSKTIFSSRSNATYAGLSFGVKAAGLYFFAHDGAGLHTAEAVSAVDIDDGAWHHCVGIADRSGNIIVRQDGAAGATTDMTAVGSIEPGVTVYIGDGDREITAVSAKDFNGTLDEIRFWKGTAPSTAWFDLEYALGLAVSGSGCISWGSEA